MKEPGEPAIRVLKDGRQMVIAEASEADVGLVAGEHPLPRGLDLPEKALRSYYALKSRVYVSCQQASIIVGTVDGDLAGFVFFSASMSALKRQARAPRTLSWSVKELLLGHLGGPREWLAYARWAMQHFRSPPRYEGEKTKANGLDVPEADTQIGTVHTVEGFRRLGVASALLDVAEGVLSRHGASQVHLWAAIDNEAALQLYVARGYKKLVEVERIGERCWLMSKALSDGARTDE